MGYVGYLCQNSHFLAKSGYPRVPKITRTVHMSKKVKVSDPPKPICETVISGVNRCFSCTLCSEPYLAYLAQKMYQILSKRPKSSVMFWRCNQDHFTTQLYSQSMNIVCNAQMLSLGNNIWPLFVKKAAVNWPNSLEHRSIIRLAIEHFSRQFFSIHNFFSTSD